MTKSVTLTDQACFEIQVNRDPIPWDLDLAPYLPKWEPVRQTVRMTVSAAPGRFMIDALYAGEPIDFSVNLPSVAFRFRAIVKEVNQISGMHMRYPRGAYECLLSPTGPVTTIPNHAGNYCPPKERAMARCMTTSKVGIEVPKGKDLTDRRFYIGSKQIFPGGNNPDWAHATIADAEAHAQKMIEETGEDQFIVKIIRVVRKRPTPVDIEKV